MPPLAPFVQRYGKWISYHWSPRCVGSEVIGEKSRIWTRREWAENIRTWRQGRSRGNMLELLTQAVYMGLEKRLLYFILAS